MTVDLLIHAVVRQTTILIAQLATSRGLRAPLASIANQVFLDLVGELERQRVSRKVCADMFGMGLRSYRRKIQRLNASATDRDHSLWEGVLEYLRERESATRDELLDRFKHDDQAQVKAVLYDLCESQLIVTAKLGSTTSYRAALGEELIALQKARGEEGLDELILALMFRDDPLPARAIARRAHLEADKVEEILERLVAAGRLKRTEREGVSLYQANRLLIPLGSTTGWEAAVFDHFKAMVATIMSRLPDRSIAPNLADCVGGSTYTISIWPGHPMEDEVYGALKRFRSELCSMRDRAAKLNQELGVPDEYARAVIYVGQCLIGEDEGERESVVPEGNELDDDE